MYNVHTCTCTCTYLYVQIMSQLSWCLTTARGPEILSSIPSWVKFFFPKPGLFIILNCDMILNCEVLDLSIQILFSVRLAFPDQTRLSNGNKYFLPLFLTHSLTQSEWVRNILMMGKRTVLDESSTWWPLWSVGYKHQSLLTKAPTITTNTFNRYM